MLCMSVSTTFQKIFDNISKWKEICQGCFQHKKHDFSFDKLNNKPSNLPEQD